MRAGRLRHRVTVQQRTTSRDSVGALVEVWATFLQVWAEVRSVSGSERLEPAPGQVVATAVHQVTLRHPGVTILPSMRLLWGSRTFEVVNVLEPDNRQRMLQLQCVEVI